MNIQPLLNRMFSAGIAAVVLTITLSGCVEKATNESSEAQTSSSTTISTTVTKQIGETISTAIQEQSSTPLQAEPLTFRVEDYAGDLDAFVYGLLISEYELCFNVFQASIELPDGDVVYGIAYTDYADYYESDDGNGFFPAGFLSLIGEPEIPADAIEKGLEITDLEIENGQSGYVYAYECEPFLEHCVIWGQYLQYGVDNHGTITYKTEQYKRGKCNEALGALYSYDEGKTVFDPDVGNFIPVTGLSLNEQIDYAELEAEVNRILDEQDFNFSTADIETTVHFAQEALNSYLLSLQIESFMGIPVDELIEKASALDPMNCIRITPEGTVEVPLNGEIPQQPDALAKWMVGVSCGIAVAASIAVGVFVPAATPLTGAVTSAAIDVFMQVVVGNHALSGVNWAKVAVSATSGALLAWACPLAASGAAGTVGKILGKNAGKFAGYATLTLGNAIVSGATSAAMGIIDGNSSEEIMDAFLIGAAIGGASTIAVTAASKFLSKGAQAINKLIENTKPGKWLAEAGNNVSSFIGKHQVHMNNHPEIEKILAPKSIEEAARVASSELNMLDEDALKLSEAIRQLPADDNPNFILLDTQGKPITKAQLLQNKGDGIIKPSDVCDERILEQFKKFNVDHINIQGGVADLKPLAIDSFPFTDDMVRDMTEYHKILANKWSENPSSIPPEIKKYLTDSQIQNLDDTMVQQALSNAKITLHEGTDKTVYLVDTYVHSKFSHFGGVAAKTTKLINQIKGSRAVNSSIDFIKQVITFSSTEIRGTYVTEEAV